MKHYICGKIISQKRFLQPQKKKAGIPVWLTQREGGLESTLIPELPCFEDLLVSLDFVLD